MKKVLALLSSALLLVGMNAYAADVGKIAVVNVQQVLLQSTKVAEANTKLQDRFKPRQDKLAAQQKSLQDEMDKFNKDSSSMSTKDRDATEKKLNNEKATFLKDAGAFQKEVSAEQNKAMQGLLSQLSSLISDMAKKGNYSLVLDSQAVAYTADGTDITKDVAKAFNDKK